MTEEELKILDKHYPPCGGCAFCGHKDKRHRLWDVFIDSPESSSFLAYIYETTLEHVESVRLIKPYRKNARNRTNKGKKNNNTKKS